MVHGDVGGLGGRDGHPPRHERPSTAPTLPTGLRVRAKTSGSGDPRRTGAGGNPRRQRFGPGGRVLRLRRPGTPHAGGPRPERGRPPRACFARPTQRAAQQTDRPGDRRDRGQRRSACPKRRPTAQDGPRSRPRSDPATRHRHRSRLSQAKARAARCPPPVGGDHPGSKERMVSSVSQARRMPPGSSMSTCGSPSAVSGMSSPNRR